MKKTVKQGQADKKEAILRAAIDEFIERGFDGARTQSIARRAGVNKALLHYYFSSKEKMYEQAFETVASFIIERLGSVVQLEGEDIEDRASKLMDVYIDVFTKYPDYIKLVLQDAMRGGTVLKRVILSKFPQILKVYTKMDGYLKKQAKLGRIRRVETVQLLISIVSQLAPVYMASSFIGEIAGIRGIAEAAADHLVKNRKKFVMELVMKGIKAG